MDILLNGQEIDALSLIVHKDKAYASGKIPNPKTKRAHTSPNV